MTLTKASLVALGMAGSMAVGVAIAPHVITRAPETPAETVAAAPTHVESQPVASAPSRQARATTTRIASVSTDAPALQARLRNVLAPGTNVTMAAGGFDSAEQFATVAYLARNTEIPFVLLKHRVLNEGRSLATAVQMSNPDINTDLEIARARAQARAEVWTVG